MEHARCPNGRLFWAAVIATAVLVVGGGALALVAYRRGGSPAGVVGDYFAALQRGDAAEVLGYGDLPPGSRSLLTARVLEKQQQIAPMRDVVVDGVTGNGAHAAVEVSYLLGFPGIEQPTSTTVSLHRAGDRWRLNRVAISTQLMLAQANDRATLLGSKVPEGTQLIFPGAAPVSYDTPYLQMSPSSAGIDFQTGATVELVTTVSPAGRARASALVRASLRECLMGEGGGTCPLPDGRYVPGSLRGTIAAKNPALTVDVDPGATGTIDVSGELEVDATYRKLDFHNRTVKGAGTLEVAVHAVSWATSPLEFVWATP